uniref:hypothetical protein n=1 Tax=Vagococcus salmoninarum TaxID=2739 RepID=UPI0028D3B6D9
HEFNGGVFIFVSTYGVSSKVTKETFYYLLILILAVLLGILVDKHCLNREIEGVVGYESR